MAGAASSANQIAFHRQAFRCQAIREQNHAQRRQRESNCVQWDF
jgi:hypothetical protein